MTGVDEPRPGISIFQRTFFVSLHSVGGLAVADTPVAAGPRHCGQKRSAGLCATAGPHTVAAARNDRMDLRTTDSSLKRRLRPCAGKRFPGDRTSSGAK